MLGFIEMPSSYIEPEIQENSEFDHLPEKVRAVKKAAQQAALRIINKLEFFKSKEKSDDEILESAKPIRDLSKVSVLFQKRKNFSFFSREIKIIHDYLFFFQ